MSWPGFHALSAAWLFLLIPPLVVLYFLKLKRPHQRVPSLALRSTGGRDAARANAGYDEALNVPCIVE